ncbi:Putative nuclease HARBI1, partial [Cyphomyrmex costatus]
VEKQIAISVYKLASCAEYRVVGNVIGVHKSTAKRCLFRVTRAINKVIVKKNIYIFMENEFISLQFKEKTFIPQLIGCIDGTHIPIIAPYEGYRDFVNRKGWPSYNVMAVVDHNGRWRISCKKMDCDYTFAPQIILACCTLHNFVQSQKEQFFTEWLQEVLDSDRLFPQPTDIQNRNRDCVPDVAVRDHLKQYLATKYPLKKLLYDSGKNKDYYYFYAY